jgi:hypothetical protein
MIFLALLIAAAPGDRRAAGHETHRTEARVAYLSAALDAVRNSPPAVLENESEYVRVLDQGACSSAVERLKVDCLMTAARRYCKKESGEDAGRCHLTMDVIVSNLLASRRLISTERRFEIMQHHTDHKVVLARELRRIEAAMAVDFRLGSSGGQEALAEEIDHYCVSSADTTNMAWQTCASSLVWFIATGSS